MKLGAVINDSATMNVGIIGLAINSIFMAFFYYYASSEFKSKIWYKIGVGALFTMACLAYSNFEDPEKIEIRFSLLITIILIILVG